jgi:hypothetical protein
MPSKKISQGLKISHSTHHISTPFFKLKTNSSSLVSTKQAAARARIKIDIDNPLKSSLHHHHQVEHAGWEEKHRNVLHHSGRNHSRGHHAYCCFVRRHAAATSFLARAHANVHIVFIHIRLSPYNKMPFLLPFLSTLSLGCCRCCCCCDDVVFVRN